MTSRTFKNLGSKFVLFLFVSGFWFQTAFALDPVKNAEDQRNVLDPVLASASSSSDPRLRMEAATAYGRIMKPEGIDPLLKLLSDSNPRVRGAATFALGQMGFLVRACAGRESEIAAEIVKTTFADPSASLRRLAVEALGKVALENAPQMILPALSDARATVQAEALMALFRYRYVLQSIRGTDPNPPPFSDEIVTAVTRLMASSSLEVRRNLAYLASRVKDSRLVSFAIQLTQDADPTVKLYAVMALGKQADASGIPAAAAACSDANYTIRVAAVTALQALQASSQIPQSLLQDPTFHVRAAVIAADSDVASVTDAQLIPFLEDPSFTVRAQAIATLAGKLGSQCGALIEDSYRDSDWRIRAAAVSASGCLAFDQETFLHRSFVDSDKRVVLPTIDALEGITTPSAFELIVEGTQSNDLSIREEAADVLTRRKEPQVLQVAWNTYQASIQYRFISLRQELVTLFAQNPNSLTTGYLNAAAKDPVDSVAQIAVNELSKRGEQPLPSVTPSPLSESPYKNITFSRNPKLRLETTKGGMELELFPKAAQIHVATIVGFAKQGSYDGLPWHRVVSDFVIQGGDPEKTGDGDAGFSLRAEINPIHYVRGTLGMPRADDFDTGGVQLFITHVPTPNLDGLYTVFGKVIRGQDVIDRIEVGDLILRATVVE